MPTISSLSAISSGSVAESDLSQLLLYALWNNQVLDANKDRQIDLSTIRQLIGDRPENTVTVGSAYNATSGDKLKVSLNGQNQEIVLPTTGTRPIQIQCFNQQPGSYGLTISSSAKINGVTQPLFFNSAIVRLIASYHDAAAGWIVVAWIGSEKVPNAETILSVVTFNGNSIIRDITGFGFAPDFFLLKCRNLGFNWQITNKLLSLPNNKLNQGSGLASADNNGFISSLSDGIKIGTGNAEINGLDWGGTNPQYLICGFRQDSTGFRIISYSGDGNSNRSIPHGFGKKPKALLVKMATATSGGGEWYFYHWKMAFNASYMIFSQGVQTNTAYFPIEPDETNFYIGNSANINQSGAIYHAYLFDNKSGFVDFNSFVGNGDTTGNSGPAVTTGFQPKLVIIKELSNGNSTYIFFSLNGTSNNTKWFILDNASAENTDGSIGIGVDFLSNGFKIKTANSGNNHRINRAGSNYLTAAFG
jgi:hypothetical protein